MSKFRKKPVVIEAVQIFENGGEEWPAWMGVYSSHSRKYAMGYLGSVETLEGVMSVRDGDWLITGVNGEHYPCKPDIFAATYEAVEE